MCLLADNPHWAMPQTFLTWFSHFIALYHRETSDLGNLTRKFLQWKLKSHGVMRHFTSIYNGITPVTVVTCQIQSICTRQWTQLTNRNLLCRDTRTTTKTHNHFLFASNFNQLVHTQHFDSFFQSLFEQQHMTKILVLPNFWYLIGYYFQPVLNSRNQA